MQIDAQAFKIDVMLCFWFAIHNEHLGEAQLSYRQEPIIAKILKTLRGTREADAGLQRVKAEEEPCRRN